MSKEEFLKLLRDMGFGRPPTNRIRHFDDVIGDPSARTYRLETELIAAGLAREGEQWDFIATVLDPPPSSTRKASTPSESQPRPSSGHLILLIHGIETYAEWADDLKKLLEQDGGTVHLCGYGKFGAVGMFLPWRTNTARNEVLQHYRDAIRDKNYSRISVFAHSFGTYLTCRLLREEPDFRPNRLMFAGSIVHETFRWETLRNRPNEIVNIVGYRDRCPLVARGLSLAYGMAGAGVGFRAIGVRNSYHDIAHSGFRSSEFMKNYLVPFLLHGQLNDSGYGRKGLPFLWGILSGRMHLLVLLILLGVLGWFLYQSW